MRQAVTKVAARTAAFLKEVWDAFFFLEEDDGIVESTGKVSKTFIGWAFYNGSDYMISAASWAMVLALKAWGWEFYQAFLAMWVYDIVVATAYLIHKMMTGADITLSMGFRSSIEIVYKRSPLVAIIAGLLVNLKAVVWDGPECIVIFFEKELHTKVRMGTAIFVLTAIQALIWTQVCYLGYETLGQLWSYYF